MIRWRRAAWVAGATSLAAVVIALNMGVAANFSTAFLERVQTWPALQHLAGGLDVPSGPVTLAQTSFQTNLTMSAPGAPTLALANGGSSCNGRTITVYSSWVNASGETAIGTASGTITGTIGKKVVITQPASPPASAVSWRNYFTEAAEGNAFYHGCGSTSIVTTTPIGTTTADCVCDHTLKVTPGSNQTHLVTAADFSGGTFTTQAYQVLNVSMDGSPYSTIGAALAVAAANASATRRYVINVGMGDYRETISATSYTEIVGASREGTRIVGTVALVTVSVPSGVTEFSMSHLTIGGKVPVDGTGVGGEARTRISFHDVQFGIIDSTAFGGQSIDCARFAGNNHDILIQQSTCYTTWDGMAVGDGDVMVINDLIQYQDDTLTQNPNQQEAFYMQTTSGGQMYVTGFRLKILSSITGSDVAAIRMKQTSAGVSGQQTVIQLTSGTIEIIGTNASGSSAYHCADLPTTVVDPVSARITLSQVDCRITTASTSRTIEAVNVTTSANHGNYSIDWNGGTIALAGSGGATPTTHDVDSGETAAGFFVKLRDVVRSSDIAGAGLTYTEGSFAAPHCSSKAQVAMLCVNTTPALCFATALDTWTKVSGGGSCP